MTPEEFEGDLKKTFPYGFRLVQDKGPNDFYAAFKSAGALSGGGFGLWVWVSGERDFLLRVRTVEKRSDEDWLLTTDDDTWNLRRMPSESQAKAFYDAIFSGDF